MTIKVGINGFGRVGRNILRVLCAREGIEVVSINDLTAPETLAYLFKYDSVHGTYPGTVESVEDGILVDGRKIRCQNEKDPANLGWSELGASYVVESSGRFTRPEDLQKHLTAGAQKVILSAPAKGELDATVVMGVNHDILQPEHRMISNASCTTNCLAPLAQVLHDRFGIVQGLMTTIHAYTNDQSTLDMVHKDLRRGRAAGVNIIPTQTGAAKAVGLVIPELAGRLNGMAMRVPVEDGSAVDLVCQLEQQATAEEINEAVREAASGSLAGILEYTEAPIVSSDVKGNPHSSIFDAGSTMVLKGGLAKCLSWYDNEWGFSSRVADLLTYIDSLT